MDEEERPQKLRKLSHETRSSGSMVNEAMSSAPAQLDTAQNAEVTVPSAADDRVTTSNPAQNGNSLPFQETSHELPESIDPLSKNQRKKLKRQADWEAGREDRKLRRKEKIKEKKARRRAEREELASGHQDASDKQALVRSKPRHRSRRHHLLPVTLIIDCGFDNLMVEKELISLGSQLTRAYSDNSRAPFQVHLYVSSWTEQSELRKRFEGLLKGMYKNWKRIRFVEEDFVGASVVAEIAMRDKWGGKMLGAFEKYAPQQKEQGAELHDQKTHENGSLDGAALVSIERVDEKQSATDVTNASTSYASQTGNPLPELKPPEHHQDLTTVGEIIYLTSDSPQTLTELKPYHTYIIGGLVDKNRHKGICYKTALNATADPQTKELLDGREIKTAKLPIGEYMSMTSRQVLATNHVVEIMLRWLEYGDWGRAFAEVMPKRKGAKLRDDGQNGTTHSDERLDVEEDEEGGLTDASDEDETALDLDLHANFDESDLNNEKLNGKETN